LIGYRQRTSSLLGEFFGHIPPRFPESLRFSPIAKQFIYYQPADFARSSERAILSMMRHQAVSEY